MVSKTRLALVMLALFALALATIALLAEMGADAFWFKVLPPGILIFGAFLAQSLGWFARKPQD